MESFGVGLKRAFIDKPVEVLAHVASEARETACGNGITTAEPQRTQDRRRAYLQVGGTAIDCVTIPTLGVSGAGLAAGFASCFLLGEPKGKPTASLTGGIRACLTPLAVVAGYAAAWALDLPLALGALVALPTALVDVRDLANSYRRETTPNQGNN